MPISIKFAKLRTEIGAIHVARPASQPKPSHAATVSAFIIAFHRVNNEAVAGEITRQKKKPSGIARNHSLHTFRKPFSATF